MRGIRMVHLMTVGSGFEARVVAGRLGAEGVVTQLRGAIDGPYPFGDVLVFVDSDDAALARELLLADQVEAAFEDVSRPADRCRSSSLALWAAIVVVAMAAVAGSLSRLVQL